MTIQPRCNRSHIHKFQVSFAVWLRDELIYLFCTLQHLNGLCPQVHQGNGGICQSQGINDLQTLVLPFQIFLLCMVFTEDKKHIKQNRKQHVASADHIACHKCLTGRNEYIKLVFSCVLPASVPHPAAGMQTDDIAEIRPVLLPVKLSAFAYLLSQKLFHVCSHDPCPVTDYKSSVHLKMKACKQGIHRQIPVFLTDFFFLYVSDEQSRRILSGYGSEIIKYPLIAQTCAVGFLWML